MNIPDGIPGLPDFDQRLLDQSDMPLKIKNAAYDGYWQPGWDLPHYILHEPIVNGWDCIIIWGIKGSKKSNREHWMQWLAYNGDWRQVWANHVMHPEQFIELIRQPGRIPVLVWDDIASWLDSGLYFDNRDLYIKIKRYWHLLRTKISVFICSAPNKAAIAGFILDDITSEMFCSPRLTYNYDRWAWQMNVKDASKVKMFPCNIETRHKFNYLVLEKPRVLNPETGLMEKNPEKPEPYPEREWDYYWKMRLEYSLRGSLNLIEALKQTFNEPPTGQEIGESIVNNMGAVTDKQLRKMASKIMRSTNPSEDPALMIELASFIHK